MGRASPVVNAVAGRPAVPAATPPDAGRRLLDAGRQLMQERRSTEFTLQDVAERARTSLRAIYDHFGNRDDFVLAVFEDAIAEAAGPLSSAVATAAGAPAKLRAYVEHLFDATFGSEHPEMPALIALHMELARTNPSALARVLAPQQAVLVDLLDRGAADGTIRTDVDPDTLAMMVSLTLISALHMNALGSHLGSAVDAETLVRYCLAAVGGTADPRIRPGGRT